MLTLCKHYRYGITVQNLKSARAEILMAVMMMLVFYFAMSTCKSTSHYNPDDQQRRSEQTLINYSNLFVTEGLRKPLHITQKVKEYEETALMV
jgi:hypothetical protein